MWLALAGIPFVLLAVVYLSIKPSAQFRPLDAEHSVLIEAAAAYITDFRAKTSHNPTSIEFETWKEAYTEQYPGLDGWGFSLLNRPYPDELLEKFGQPPREGFVLMYWGHGAWIEYVSWFGNGKQAYVPDAEYFTPFYGRWSAVLAFALIAVIFFALARTMCPSAPTADE